MPTIMFPENMDRVDNMSTFTGSPRVIAMTSFEASMLKAPPRKNPVTPESTIHKTISNGMDQYSTRQNPIIKQE